MQSHGIDGHDHACIGAAGGAILLAGFTSTNSVFYLDINPAIIHDSLLTASCELPQGAVPPRPLHEASWDLYSYAPQHDPSLICRLCHSYRPKVSCQSRYSTHMAKDCQQGPPSPPGSFFFTTGKGSRCVGHRVLRSILILVRKLPPTLMLMRLLLPLGKSGS